MAYYRGDYYAGDYYRGDFWSKAKKKLKKVAKNPLVQQAALGLVPGGSFIQAGLTQAKALGLSGAGRSRAAAALPSVMEAGAALVPTNWPRLLAGGGALSDRPFRVGGRRMNITNVKALRRAMRRVQGFAHLAKSTIQFTKATRMKKRGRKS